MSDILKVLKSLVSDIEAMQMPDPNWFGNFSESAETEYDGVSVEWPNLAISLEAAKKVIDTCPVDVEAAARRLERARRPEWTDEQFEIWWTKDPFFTQHVTNWSHFGPGTRKDHVIWEARQVLGIDSSGTQST